jgi:hypothetical protein
MSKRNRRLNSTSSEKPRLINKDDIPGFIAFWSNRMYEVLRYKGDLTEDEKTYLMSKLENMKDEQLKSIITGLIGWGDEERGEIETFVAISIEVLKLSTPSKIREAARIVELRSVLHNLAPNPSLEQSKNYVVVDDTSDSDKT